MINLDKGYKIERYESNLVHRVKADVPVPGHPGWRTKKVAQETPMELPMSLNVEDKLFDMQGPTYIFRLAKLRDITPPIDSLNEYFLHITFQFISNEPLKDYDRLTGGLVSVHILGGVGEYEFKGVGKKRSHNVTYPDLHLFESKREEQNIRTLFYWKPQVQGRFTVPEDMVGAKQFGEMAVNEEVIKGKFVYDISAAYWISFLGAILGLPMCGGGAYFIRKYFKHRNAVFRKILILSSNPKTTPRLRLDEEVREIEEGLRRSKHRGQFEIQSKLAVRLRDLRRALLDVEPQIVHFTGHGKKDGLLVEDDLGNAVGISTKTLSALFALSSNLVECVILSACYSAPQAAAISKHINYVIGMRKEIKDKAAIEFAVGFYDALGAGKSVEQAFEFGCNAIRQILPDLPEHLIPVLKKGTKA